MCRKIYKTMCKNNLKDDVQVKILKSDVQENLQNDVQEHCADAQEQKKFSQIGKSCEAGFLKISLGKTFSSKYPWEKYFPQNRNIWGENMFSGKWRKKIESSLSHFHIFLTESEGSGKQVEIMFVKGERQQILDFK